MCVSDEPQAYRVRRFTYCIEQVRADEAENGDGVQAES